MSLRSEGTLAHPATAASSGGADPRTGPWTAERITPAWRGRLVGLVAGILAVVAGGCDAGGADLELEAARTSTLAEAGASNPTVAVAPTGTWVAWVGTEDGASNVLLARAGADGASGEPVRVNDIPGDAAPHAQAPAQVAAGPDGQVYVVWQNNTPVEGRRFPASDLRFARSADGGRTFEPAIHVNDDAGGPPASHTFQDMVVAPDGTIYVSWIDGRSRTHVEGAAGTAGGEDAADGADGAHPRPPEDGTDPGPDIRVARSTDGGRSFGPGHVVDAGACPCCRTSLALGPDGGVYVAWRKVFDGSERDVVVARSTDGGRTWSEPVRVHRDGWRIDACPHAGPAVAVTPDGRVHVAWYTGAEGAVGAYYAAAGPDLAFGAPTRLTPEGLVPATEVALAPAGSARVWIAWEEGDAAGERVRLALASAEGLRPVDAGTLSGRLPELEAAGERLAVAWLDGEAARVLEAAATR